MKYMKNIEICVRAIIKSKGRILVCRHKEKKYYFFPGGHVDFGERAPVLPGFKQ
jgi:ADP-ribose pyrophosphatase YjhB (NUDIX family)